MTASKLSQCPICRHAATTVIRADLYDDRYGYPGLFSLRHCAACDHRFLDATFSPEELGRLYSAYYPRAKFDLEQWAPHAEMGALRTWLGRERSAVFRWVPRGVKVLDIGCGFGQSLGYHRARGCEAQGIDPDENLQRVADRHGLNARVGLFHAADFPAAYFDYVTLDQVIEHAADPVQLLREAAMVARPGGTLLLSTPNARSLTARLFGARWVHFHAPYHLQLFSSRSLRAAADAAGLRVVTLRSITQPRWYGFQWLHLLARPRPGETSPFWDPSKRWPRRLVPVRKTISVLGRLGLNHALAHGLDALRLGDNLVAVLEKPRE